VINDLQRLLGKFRQPRSLAPRHTGPADLQMLRDALLESVRDCRADLPALRLHARIVRAPTAEDLWHLRASAHDVIARHHCQTVAAERIRRLAPLLEGERL
jgi:hypothetical protein